MVISKKNKLLVVITVVIFFIAVFVNVLHSVKVEKNNCYGIGVDSMGQLYVAKDNMIEIYANTSKIKEIECRHIDPKKRFTIKDDFIVIFTSITGYYYQKLDLNGQELVERVDITEEEYDILNEKSYNSRNDNGDIYEYNDDKFQYRILLNEETVIYEEPLFNAVIEMLVFYVSAMAMILFALTLFRLSKDNNWK